MGGPYVAMILYSLNYRRLGQGRAAVLCFLGLLLFAVGILFGIAYSSATGLEGYDPNSEENGARRWITRLGTAAVALGLSLHQQRRFRLFQGTGGEAGKLFLPGVLAFLAGVFLFYFTFVLFGGTPR